MENFYTILTRIGQAKIANSQVTNKKVNLVEMAAGDGGGKYYNPTDTQTELVNEVWRGNIGSIAVDEQHPNWIVIETVIPTDTQSFMVREIGVFDDEGDMIAIGKYPETFKPSLGAGGAKDLYIRMIIEVTNAESVTLKIDPAVTIASRQFVDEKTAEVEQNAKNYTNQLVNQINQEVEDLEQDLSAHLADLTSQDVGKGADMIGLPDPNNLFTATNVGGAMQELFTNVSNGKLLIGGAITDVNPNVVIPTDPTFQDLANAIGMLGGGVKSVQSGLETFERWSDIRDITISDIDPSKSVVLIKVSSNGPGPPADNACFSCEIIDNTTIRLQRTSATNTLIMTVTWTVIEFENVKSLQTGRQAHTGTPTTVSINNVDVSKSLLLFSHLSTATASSAGYFLVSGTISSPTSLEFRSSGQAVYVWQVIEFE